MTGWFRNAWKCRTHRRWEELFLPLLLTRQEEVSAATGVGRGGDTLKTFCKEGPSQVCSHVGRSQRGPPKEAKLDLKLGGPFPREHRHDSPPEGLLSRMTTPSQAVCDAALGSQRPGACSRSLGHGRFSSNPVLGLCGAFTEKGFIWRPSVIFRKHPYVSPKVHDRLYPAGERDEISLPPHLPAHSSHRDAKGMWL